ncbi:MAG TPA: methyltransferase domain-containing protein [Rhodanobacter sp.]
MLQRDHDIYASAPLRRLLDDQTRVMTPDLQRCFGTHALLIGTSLNDAPPVLPMLRCWIRLWAGDGKYQGDVHSALEEPLPFVDDAFELVLLRHALEVVPAAPELLAESIRVLAPGGILAVTGVHPIGGWALWFHWHARDRQQLHMPLRLRHALQQAGMEIEKVQRVGHLWPRATETGSGNFNAWGGGYVLIARKRHRAANPLRIKPVPMRAPVNGQLSPGTRRSSAL